MSCQHWGEFDEDSDSDDCIVIDPVPVKKKKSNVIHPSQKKGKVPKNLKPISFWEPMLELPLNNALVTQTVEVLNQTDMVQTLIDTYDTKSGSGGNNLSPPGQILPQVDFPPENSANFIDESKFCKPIWFIPKVDTNFTAGQPKCLPSITKLTCRVAIRKSACALLRVAGYSDTSANALSLVTDAVDDYIKEFLQLIRNVQIQERQERDSDLKVLTIEKAYYEQTGTSLVSLHNYYKNQVITKNLNGIAEFKDAYQQYNKMKGESEQNMQKEMFEQSESTSANNTDQQTSGSNVNIVSYVDMTVEDSGGGASSNTGNFAQGEIIEVDATTSDED